MGKPSEQTVKKLFALSGNLCAFPKCKNRLIDDGSGTLTARICHIKGNKVGSARHDPRQSEDDRQGLGNLVLMCPIHHDVIDADEESYTVERLLQIKAQHELRCQGSPTLDPDLVGRFAVAVLSNTITGGSIIATTDQSGGQTAHSITNIQLAQPTAQEPRLTKDLRARNLDDATSPLFCTTRYSQRMGLGDEHGRITPLATLGILFACTPGKLCVGTQGEGKLIRWMDCNTRRYEPFPTRLFVPSPAPDRIGKAHVWHDGHRQRFLGPRCFTQYLALEPEGYAEYGFYPSSWMDSETDGIYYARVLAGFVAFLHFVRDLCGHAGHDPAGASVGLALRGIRGKRLLCITKRVLNHFQHTTPAEHDGLLFLRQAALGTEWGVDEVVREAAEALLDVWLYSVPGGFGTPEFKGDRYEGEYFKDSFQSF